ncbi:hypothetical protein AB0C10_14560 [Microbispora amethystogenes]|uniref:DUF7662 domain-containing protein n=1 Tax=Microbispora amethystogenes TaxID=1427754 RepID=UPI0033F7AEA0
MPGERGRADYSRLTTWLRERRQDAVIVTWDELDELVGGLPRSAVDHYPQWWHGDRPNTRAWRAAGYELDRVEIGRCVRFRRVAAPEIAISPRSQSTAVTARVDELTDVSPRRTLVVIPCSAAKARGGEPAPGGTSCSWPEALLEARARLRLTADVDEGLLLPAWRRYEGFFYRAAGSSLQQAVRSGVPILILSGGYGVVRAEDAIGYYEKILKRRDWPPGLLQSLLAEEASRLDVDAVVAFTAARGDYAAVVRDAPWRERGVSPVFHMTMAVEGGGAMVKVPRGLGQAFAAFWARDRRSFPAGTVVERLS